MDVDGIGFVNREELQRIFNVLGVFEVSEHSVDEMMIVYDSNRDGVLSFSEFLRLTSGLPLVVEILLSRSHEYWSQREKLERLWNGGTASLSVEGAGGNLRSDGKLLKGAVLPRIPSAGQGLSAREHVEAVERYLSAWKKVAQGQSAHAALRREFNRIKD
jgi:hypothetical protein